jgi:hypothetical protein
VEEPEFWGRLEYRICEESRGSEDDHLRWCRCDGLVPERYDRHDRRWHISGLAWTGTDSRQEPWTFTLITRHAGDQDAPDWAGLLPSDRLTGWLTPDPAGKTIKIDPAAGHDN